MSFCRLLVPIALALCVTSKVASQDFGVMESAEIIQRGTLKFTAYPVFVLGEDGADGEVGGALRSGYGFTDRLDAELGLAFYDQALLFGGNLEVAVLGAGPAAGGVDLSVRGGAHLVRGDVADGVGLDLAALLGMHLTPDLELLGSIDFNQSFYDEPFEDVHTFHLVPGVEYAVSSRLDVLAEFGLGLSDAAANYLSAGLALYFR